MRYTNGISMTKPKLEDVLGKKDICCVPTEYFLNNGDSVWYCGILPEDVKENVDMYGTFAGKLTGNEHFYFQLLEKIKVCPYDAIEIWAFFFDFFYNKWANKNPNSNNEGFSGVFFEVTPKMLEDLKKETKFLGTYNNIRYLEILELIEVTLDLGKRLFYVADYCVLE